MASKNKATFREAHITEITLYEAARKFLKDAGYLKKGNYLPNMKDLKEKKQELTALKNQQYESYSFARAKYREIQAVHRIIHQMLATNDRGMINNHRRNIKTDKEKAPENGILS